MGFLRKKYFGEVICFDLFVCFLSYMRFLCFYGTPEMQILSWFSMDWESVRCAKCLDTLPTMHLSDLSYGES